MKKAILLSIAVVLAVFAVTFGAGCIGGDPIVGEWETAGAGIPVVFNDDGTGALTVNVLGFSKDFTLTWKPVEGFDNKYTITATGDAVPVGEYTISDDGKILKGPITLNKVVEE